MDRIEGLLQKPESDKKLDILYQHAQKAKHLLEKVDTNLFNQLRENIRSGIYTPSSFNKMVHHYLVSYFNTVKTDKVGYDNLDIFINRLLSNQPVPETTLELRPKMVFYQKTPARIIFRMTELVSLKQDDVFFDIGSGLGQVTILMNLLTGVISQGVEYEPAYCNYAKHCTRELNLPHVEFTNSDAYKADYSQGTIFFLYTPFEGRLLQNMLNVLQEESQNRTITVFTYGPCSPDVAQEYWLSCVNGTADDFYELYKFKSLKI